MKNKERAKNYNALYKKQHWFAIALKNQMYKSLAHIKERCKQENRKRKGYFKKYYQEHKDYFRNKSSEWLKRNPGPRKLILKRYSEKLRLRKKRMNMKSKLERVIKEFIDYCKDRYDSETLKQYRLNINRFFSFVKKHSTHCKEYHDRWYREQIKPQGERDFSWTKDYKRIQYTEEIDRDFITKYVSYVNHDEISPKSHTALSQAEQETRLYPLKSFLWYCLRKDYLKKDLRKFVIVPPREKKILKKVLTYDEMIKLLNMPKTKSTLGLRDRALLELSYSGLRSGEILNLKIKDVDLITNSVTILNAKGDKDRVVPMTTEAVYWIKRWLSKRDSFVRGKTDEEYMFITKGAKPIIRRQFAKLLRRYSRKADLSIEVSPHDLRRTTATHLAENGAPIRLVQALLGHATLKVTTKYLRLTDEKVKKEHKETHPANRRSLYYARVER